MPAIVYAFRRGGSCFWRRRIPLALTRFCRATQIVVSLRIRDPARAATCPASSRLIRTAFPTRNN